MSDTKLPDLEFIDTNPETILNRMITKYELMADRKLYASDPVRLHINYMVYLTTLLRTEINETAKMNLIRYADGKLLESLCDIFYNIHRKEAQQATVKLRFTITKVQETPILIPKDTIVTVDGEINFFTINNVYINAGEIAVDAEAVCGIPGIIGNGFVPGQISKLVTPFNLFESVLNVTESSNGFDEESDYALRSRATGSVKAYSTAGAMDSYSYHVKAEFSEIADVRVTSESAGVVTLRILCQNGKLPTDELLNTVKEKINGKSIRPLTDKVEVLPPETAFFSIDFTFYVDADRIGEAAVINTAVHEAVEKYIAWQTNKIGRDINPSYFVSLIINAGARRVDLTEPHYRKVEDSHVPVLEKPPDIKNGGIEDE